MAWGWKSLIINQIYFKWSCSWCLPDWGSCRHFGQWTSLLHSEQNWTCTCLWHCAATSSQTGYWCYFPFLFSYEFSLEVLNLYCLLPARTIMLYSWHGCSKHEGSYGETSAIKFVPPSFHENATNCPSLCFRANLTATWPPQMPWRWLSAVCSSVLNSGEANWLFPSNLHASCLCSDISMHLCWGSSLLPSLILMDKWSLISYHVLWQNLWLSSLVSSVAGRQWRNVL